MCYIYMPDYPGYLRSSKGCAACSLCAICLSDGPIPDFEGFAIAGIAGLF
ncbi:subtilosin A family bacteriocin [Anaerocellum danielii]|uniref:Subtilosin A family bacteriocin n=1 Tax=Anaerocellum danielii TaxID=1387557 RepID=A0ABZ0U1S8_9FIRM|nr:subtilosin A family bacteriocin [Caldicellulosiruptor danielii]WPX09668.1 subtilosin A family bacteriocin [Caldicellulosiruptor danielii]